MPPGQQPVQVHRAQGVPVPRDAVNNLRVETGGGDPDGRLGEVPVREHIAECSQRCLWLHLVAGLPQ